MPKLVLAALGAWFLVASLPSAAGAAGPAGGSYATEDLLAACTEGDNAARKWGEMAELECEQYVMGFVHALQLAGETTVCAPEVNTADEVRWGFMRWVHESYGARIRMPAGEALLGSLREKFPCN